MRRMSPDSSPVPREKCKDDSSLYVNSKPALCIVISEMKLAKCVFLESYEFAFYV